MGTIAQNEGKPRWSLDAAGFWYVWHFAMWEYPVWRSIVSKARAMKGRSIPVKVTMERLAESQVKLDITADEQEFAEAVEKAAKKVAKDIAVPGFRKGHVPRHMIERMYGRDIFLEEAGRLIMDDLYREAIESNDLNPVGDPNVQITEVDPIAFTVVVPVYPEVDPGDYQSIRAETEDAGIDDADIDEVIERVRKSSSPWVDPGDERGAREGDQVSLNLAIFDGDEPFQDPIEDAQFIIGESDLFPDLRDALLEMKPGDKTEVDLTFAEDDEAAAEQLRGKTLRYNVELIGIKERELLEVDDEFAKTYAGEETVDALRDAVRHDLHQGKTTETRTRVVNSIIDQLGERASVEIPSVMIDDAVKREIGRMRQRFQMQRSSLEAFLRSTGQTEEELAVELRPTVEKQVRNSVTLREIANREGIDVTDDEIDEEIEAIVSASPNPEQMRVIYGGDRYMRSVLQDEIFNERLTDRIVEIATEGRGAVSNGYVPADGESTGRGMFRGSQRKSRGASTSTPELEGAMAAVADALPEGSATPLEGGLCPDDFPIKGNLQSMIFHQPGQGSYDPTEAEICFATAEDAEAAGYRASKARGHIAEAGDALAESASELEGDS